MPYPRKVEPGPPPGRIRMRIRELALERNLLNQHGEPNCKAIEEGAGLAHNTVWKLLRREENVHGLRFDVAQRLCYFFACGLDELLEWEPPPGFRFEWLGDQRDIDRRYLQIPVRELTYA
jgi:DNA-binding Xre family transcriptional regulator